MRDTLALLMPGEAVSTLDDTAQLHRPAENAGVRWDGPEEDGGDEDAEGEDADLGWHRM